MTRILPQTRATSENVKKFRTDTAPELDWYQPCAGGDNLINFYIKVHDVDVSSIKSATLTLAVWDVDYDCGTACDGICERDTVYINGHRLTTPKPYLTGADNQWSTCTFNVEPEWIVGGDNYVEIYIDLWSGVCWCVECDWGELSVTLEKPPEIEEIIITGPPSDPKNPMTKKDGVTFEAKITEVPGYEVIGINWEVIDVATGKMDFFGKDKNPYTHSPAPGTHGMKKVLCTIFYENTAACVIGLNQESKEFKLFFEKGSYPDWVDDGSKPKGPNWFKYWKRDGAVPNMNLFNYDPKGGYGSCDVRVGDWATGTGAVYVGPPAAWIHYPSTYTIPAVGGITFGGAEGIDCTAEVCDHELYHRWVHFNWKKGWTKAEDPDGDGLINAYENTTSLTDIHDPDTHNVAGIRHHPPYAIYGDHEWMAMRAGDGKKGIDEKDWANPGSQTDGVTASLSEFTKFNALKQSSWHVEQTISQTEFVGNYSDYGNDTNGNSLYDYLTITLDANVTYTGYYIIVG